MKCNMILLIICDASMNERSESPFDQTGSRVLEPNRREFFKRTNLVESVGLVILNIVVSCELAFEGGC